MHQAHLLMQINLTAIFINLYLNLIIIKTTVKYDFLFKLDKFYKYLTSNYLFVQTKKTQG